LWVSIFVVAVVTAGCSSGKGVSESDALDLDAPREVRGEDALVDVDSSPSDADTGQEAEEWKETDTEDTYAPDSKDIEDPDGIGPQPGDFESPSISLTLSSDRALVGGAVTASWTATGTLPGQELVVFVRTPGSMMLWDGNVGGSTGTNPPTGPVFYLSPELDWEEFWQGEASSDALPGISDVSAQGQVSLPVLDSKGEWRVAVMLRDSVTRRISAADFDTVWVTDGPTVRLSMNRWVGTTRDEFQATVEVSAGGSDEDIRVLAWIWLDDGIHVWSLPGPVEDHLVYAYEGPAKDMTIPLLGQRMPFPTPYRGYYEVAVRLLNAQGRVIGLAEQWFQVRDNPLEVEGTVRGVDGTGLWEGVVRSSVSFWDLVGGGMVAKATINEWGQCYAQLPVGHYLAIAEIQDAQGIHRGQSRAILVEGSMAVRFDMSTAPPEPCVGSCLLLPFDSPSPAKQRPFPGPVPPSTSTPWIAEADGLPKPQVYVGYAGRHGFPPYELSRVQRKLEDILTEEEPEVMFTGRSEVQSILIGVSDVMLVGTDEGSGDDRWILERVQQVLDLFDAVDFIITVQGENLFRKEVFAFMVDLAREVGVLATDRFLVGTVDKFMDEPLQDQAAAFLAEKLLSGGSLFSLIRSLQDRPIHPLMEITLTPRVVIVGSPLVVTVTLTDLDGTVQPNKIIEIWNTNGDRTLEAPRPCTTDEQGRCTVTVPAISSFLFGPVSEGKIAAVYIRATGQRFAVDPPKSYSILRPSSLQVVPERVMMKPGERAELRITYREGGNPVPEAAVTLTAPMGTLAQDVLTTDSTGSATTWFTAGTQSGMAVIQASANEGQTVGEARIHLDGDVRIELEVIPASVGPIPQTAAVVGRVTMGEDLLPNAPVRLSAWRGAIFPSDVTTDAAGNFQTLWLSPPPGAGPGTSTITATVAVDQYRYEATAEVAFEDPTWVPPEDIYQWNGVYSGTCMQRWCCVDAFYSGCDCVDTDGTATLTYHVTGQPTQWNFWNLTGTATVTCLLPLPEPQNYKHWVFDLSNPMISDDPESFWGPLCLYGPTFYPQLDGSTIAQGSFRQCSDFNHTTTWYFEVTRPAP
jgi:hypothetical protein